MAQHKNYTTFNANLDVRMITLEDDVLRNDAKKEEIYNLIDDFKSATTICCIKPILQKINVASVLLQEKASDIGKITPFGKRTNHVNRIVP